MPTGLAPITTLAGLTESSLVYAGSAKSPTGFSPSPVGGCYTAGAAVVRVLRSLAARTEATATSCSSAACPCCGSAAAAFGGGRSVGF